MLFQSPVDGKSVLYFPLLYLYIFIVYISHSILLPGKNSFIPVFVSIRITTVQWIWPEHFSLTWYAYVSVFFPSDFRFCCPCRGPRVAVTAQLTQICSPQHFLPPSPLQPQSVISGTSLLSSLLLPFLT